MIENERQANPKGSLAKTIGKNIKLSFFTTYNACLVNVTINSLTAHIVILLSFFNIIFYLFDEHTKIYISANNANYIKMIPRILNIGYYFKVSSVRLKVFSYIFISIHSLLFILLVSLLFFYKRIVTRKYSFVYSGFYYYSVFLYWIIFIPVLDISLHIFGNEKGTAILIISGINIFLVFLLTISHSFFGNRSLYSLSKIDAFSRADCNFELFYLISRTLLIILYFFTVHFDINNWTVIAGNIVFAIAMIIFNFNKFLFYHRPITKIFFMCILLHLYCGIIGIIVKVTPYKEPFWFILLGAIVLYYTANGIVDKYLLTLIRECEFPYLLNKPYIVDQYMKTLSAFLRSKSPNDVLMVSGISDYLDKECNYSAVMGGNSNNSLNQSGIGNNSNPNILSEPQSFYSPLVMNGVFYIPSKRDFMTKENFQKKEKYYNLCFILSLYWFYLKNVKHATVFLSYLNFQFEDIGNYLEILFHLLSVEHSIKSLSLQEEFSLYRMKLQTQERCKVFYNYSFNDLEKRKLKIKDVIEYYSLVTLLKRKMIESANASFSFWNNFVFNSDNANIYQNGIEIFEYGYQLENLFSKIRKIYPRDDFLNLKFSEYIRYVKGDEKLAMKYQNNNEHNLLMEHFDEIREIEKLNNLKEFFFSPDTVIFIVNFTKERTLVEKCTEAIYPVFGLTAHQMIGKELENFMSPFFKERHQSFVNFHFLTGIKRVIGDMRQIYAYNSKHFCFLIKLMVMMLPSMSENKILYMGVIQRISVDYGIILVLPNGKIDSFSEKISKVLGLSNEDIIENDIYIYHIVMGMLITSKKGKEKVIDNVRKFKMTPCELTKMKFCTDPSITINYSKAIHQYESNSRNLLLNNNRESNSIANNTTSLKDIVNMYVNSLESSQWPMFETEIIEEKYHCSSNVEQNTIYCIRVFVDDDNDEEYSENISQTKNVEPTMGGVNITTHGNNEDDNGSKSVKPIPEDNYDDSSKLLAGSLGASSHGGEQIVIKNLNIPISPSKNRIREVLMEAKNNQETNNPNNPNKLNEILKFKRLDGLSSIASNMSSSLYVNYSNFRKKLNEHLTETPRSLFAQIIGIIVFLIELVSSILIFYFEYQTLQSTKEVFETISSKFTRYDDLNCIEKLFNEDYITTEIFKKEMTAEKSKMFEECVDNLLRDQNYLSQITQNDMINNIKFKYYDLTFNYSYLGEAQEIPSFQFLMIMVDYMIKLSSQEGSENSSNFDFVRSNIDNFVDSLFDDTKRINNQVFNDKIRKSENLNYIFLSLRLCVIFISFIIILPILIIKKTEQIQILDNFFQIKPEDAEMQKESCKKFIESTTNFKLDSEDKDEIQNGTSKKKTDENTTNNVAFSSTAKEKAKTEHKNKKAKQKASPFTARFFIIMTIIIILIIILLISIIPIINFKIQLNVYSKSKKFIQYKTSIDDYAFSMENTIIYIQSILLTIMNKQQIPNTILVQYNQSYNQLFENEIKFSDFTSLAYDLSKYDTLYDFLQRDMCTVFTNMKYNVSNCDSIQNSNAQKGIKPIYSQITSILTDLSQTIISKGNQMTEGEATSMYNSSNFQYLSMIIDKFVIEGFNLVLELLHLSYKDDIISQNKILIVMLCLFIVILMINQVVIWNNISAKIHSMETDTYKLFSILPIGFITEYPSLLEFLNKITKEDN